VGELPGPSLDAKSGAGETSMIAESTYTSSDLVDKNLKLVQDRAATGESAENLLVALLALVAVCEVNEVGLEREVFFGELLETKNDGSLRSIGPDAGFDKLGSGSFIF